MCGILGQISFSDRAYVVQQEAILSRLMGLMARRGPDDEGIWSDGRQCVLAFRRLAILDLSENAHQPMLTPDGRYALVYNGEVYNFRELRRVLEQKGVQFHSKGDTGHDNVDYKRSGVACALGYPADGQPDHRRPVVSWS